MGGRISRKATVTYICCFRFTVTEMVIMPSVLGLTWIIGMAAVLEHDSIYQGVFAILNIIQVKIYNNILIRKEHLFKSLNCY